MKRTNRLTEGNILHTLIRFAVPVFFTLFLQALYGGVDGLDFYRAICENWGDTLAHGGILLFECGWKQADAVAEILQKYGFSDVCIEKDDAGVPRIVIGRSSREDDDLTK